MKVTQQDSRTILVRPESGAPFRVPYRFFWNGHDRPAESIVLTTGGGGARGTCEVRAFFLFGEVRDTLTSDAAGITLLRTWSVKTPGTVHLSIDVEFEAPADLRWLFPGVNAGSGLPSTPVSLLGEKTSYPAALYLSMGKSGVLLYSRTAACGGAPAGIGIGRAEIEDEAPRLRVEVRFPGVEAPLGRVGPVPMHTEEPVEAVIESPGSLERSHELFLAFAPRAEVALTGAGSAWSRLMTASPKKRSPEPPVDPASLRESLQGVIGTHLWQRGGVVGVREVPGSPWLSSSAGLGLAVALRRLFPRDGRLLELALRLADFSLKGQAPSGFFYDSYHLEAEGWRGVRGEAARTLLSVGQSSRIAELLLVLAADLARDNLPHEKYFLAGLRFSEFFLDGKGRLGIPGSLCPPGDRAPASGDRAPASGDRAPASGDRAPASGDRAPASPPAGGLGGLELFFPLARVYEWTGRDKHKKALDVLVKRFSTMPWDPFQPPCSRDGRGSDSTGALVAARLYVEMRALGYKPVEPPVSTAAAAKARAAESARLFASLLVPWIRVHTDAPGAGGDTASPGCLADSFARQRLLYAGNETALLLLKLARLVSDTGISSLLKSVARLCCGSGHAVPLGTAFFQHTRWDEKGKPAEGRGRRGPVDARRCAAEVLAGLRIAEEFPRL
jgi:hypothetical protein